VRAEDRDRLLIAIGYGVLADLEERGLALEAVCEATDELILALEQAKKSDERATEPGNAEPS